MVSSVGRANGGGGGKDSDDLRPWLAAFLHATYFVRCSLHADSYRNQRNMFCTDCMGDPVCLRCARIDHKDHTVIQVRKSCDREVVSAREMQEFIDISGIQTSNINRATVVFLNKRPQANPRKHAINACEVCCKTLATDFRFCSISCKLGATMRGDTNFSYKETQHSGGPRIGVPVPDPKEADGCNPYSAAAATAAADAAVANATPSAKPVFDHSNSRKRKGTLRRARSL